jgi:hypothetical protein
LCSVAATGRSPPAAAVIDAGCGLCARLVGWILRRRERFLETGNTVLIQMAQRHTDKLLAVDGLNIARRFETGGGKSKLNVDERAAEINFSDLVEELARPLGPTSLGGAVVGGLGEFAVEVLTNNLAARRCQEKVRGRGVEHTTQDAMRGEQLIDRRTAHFPVGDRVLSGDVLSSLHLNDSHGELVISAIDDKQV